MVGLGFVFLIFWSRVASFECDLPSDSGCVCFREENNKYEEFSLFCLPEKLNMSMRVLPGRLAEVTCFGDITSEEFFTLVKQVKIGTVNILKLMRCPYPSDSYHQLMKDMGISGVKWLDILGVAGAPFDKNLLSNLPVMSLRLNSVDNITIDENFSINSTEIQELSLVRTKVTLLSFHFPKLKKLNLISCGISSLDGGIFKDMTNLEIISLHRNELTELPGGIFDSLVNIRIIQLSENKLRTLPEGIFENNKQLQEAFLSFNCFQSFPEHLFSDKRNIQAFDLQSLNDKKCPNRSGRVKLPGTMFQNSSITSITFSHVNIEKIPKNFLKGCKNLLSFIMQSGSIENIPKGLFKDTLDIDLIDFAYNEIKEIAEETFKGLKTLTKLNLLRNRFHSLDPNMMTDLISLKTLHLSYNHIADLSDNNLPALLPNLEELDLSHNMLSRVPGWIVDDILVTTRMRKLDLSGNNICDCFVTEIKKANKDNIVVDNIGCPHNKSLSDISYLELNCPFPSAIILAKCPQSCKCDLNRHLRRIIVNCSGQALTHIPVNLPIIPKESDGIILHMENNHLTNMTEILQMLSKNNLTIFNSLSEMHLSNNLIGGK